jgi:MafB19-like deaminase
MSGGVGEVNNNPVESVNNFSIATDEAPVQTTTVDDQCYATTPDQSTLNELLNPSDLWAVDNMLDPRPRFLALAENAPTTALAAIDTPQADLTPKQRALLSLDLAAAKLEQADGDGAATILDNAARQAREDARSLNPTSAEARFLTAFADNAEARADVYRVRAPQEGFQTAGRLSSAAYQTEQLAAELERSGATSDARVLRAIAADSRIQAQLTSQGAANTNTLIGLGLSQTYQQVVNASFDQRIANARDWAYPWESQSPAATLRQARQKMQVVFEELNRTMREEGVSLDRAWNMMFEDNRMDGFRAPARVPGFVSRNDAATFLRDHEVTKQLLTPFADMARGATAGNAAGIDRGHADLVQALRNNGQWEVSRAVLNQLQADAQTAEGRAAAERLNASESREWWTAKTGEFIREDLPILVLSGLVSGGVGTGARLLATAAGWSTRAVRATQVAVELGTFVPTERILNEAINGQRADWSASALARDYAFTLGGYGLFRAAGRGWTALRESGFGQSVIGRLRGEGEMLNFTTPRGRTITISRRALEDMLSGPAAANARIAAYRQTHGMPAIDLTPGTGGPTGTVATVRLNGRDVYGLNTTLERQYLGVDTLAARQAVLTEIQQTLGKMQGATIARSGQFLTHAEAQALMNAQRQFGRLPERVTLFVDRPTCPQCFGSMEEPTERGLRVLAELYGVKELTVIDSLGGSLLIRPNQPTVRLR